MLLLEAGLRWVDPDSFFDGLETLFEADAALLHVGDCRLKLQGKHTNEASEADADGPRNRLEILVLL